MLNISLQNIYKAYEKDKMVIKDFSLEIFEGEFVVFVGPSGCGKTTTLRMIAGLEEITKGELYINDVLQNDLDPASRNLSFVFQNYALLPNFSVYDNIEFGLLNMKLDKLTRKRLVEDVAKKLEIYEKLGSFVPNLSGGQRQRVALARALVDEKKLVLFDEPLSNLDAVLRTGMRKELMLFKERFGVTSIYVTHDQVEALTMASRIVLLMAGKIIQVGTGLQLYNEPVNLTAAKFMGTPEINIIEGIFKEDKFVNKYFEIDLSNVNLKINNEEKGYLGIRAENIGVSDSLVNEQSFLGKVNYVEYIGYNQIIHFNVNDLEIAALSNHEVKEGASYYLTINNYLMFDKEGVRIKKEDITFIYFNNVRPPANIEREVKNYGYQIAFDKPNNSYIEIKKEDSSYVLSYMGKTMKKIKRLEELFKHLIYQTGE